MYSSDIFHSEERSRSSPVDVVTYINSLLLFATVYKKERGTGDRILFGRKKDINPIKK